MLPHALTNFEIWKCYQNEPKVNAVYSKNNLPKIKDGSYVIHLDEYESVGTHWMPLYVNDNNIMYFDTFGVKHIPKKEMKNKKFKGNRNIITYIYRIKEFDLIMCEYIGTGFVDFMLKNKSLLDYTN